MGWSLFQSKPSATTQLANISKKVKDITKDARTINESLVSISHTNALLGKVMDKFESADFSNQKTRIDGLRLEDEYKKELKESIDKSKALAMKTLKPLVDKAQKLEGGMIAAEIKAKQMLVILETQRKVLGSGQMQLNVIKDIEKEGQKNEEEIKKLVADVEEINGMTKNVLLGYNASQGQINDILSDSPTLSAGASELEDIVAEFENL